MNKRIVMLYSGGADSRLMINLAQMSGRDPYCVLIDYGQKHIDELRFAKEQLKDLGVDYQVISIHGLNVNSGLTGDLTDARWDNVHPMNVPARNTIFIGLAMSVAENMGVDEVWYGPDYSDRVNLFPDCYQEYVVRMNEVLAISGVKPIKLVAPLLGMSKELVLEILETFWGVAKAEMHSGYEAPASSNPVDPNECVKCDCCKETNHIEYDTYFKETDVDR
jgi:7-cyano-7-deazaguanine synthase